MELGTFNRAQVEDFFALRLLAEKKRPNPLLKKFL